jgi:hypothetical protein
MSLHVDLSSQEVFTREEDCCSGAWGITSWSVTDANFFCLSKTSPDAYSTYSMQYCVLLYLSMCVLIAHYP